MACLLDCMRASETAHAEPAFTLDAPSYRVNFRQRSGEGAWALDAFVLTEVRDVTKALEWTEEHASGRCFELFAEDREAPIGSFKTPRTSRPRAASRREPEGRRAACDRTLQIGLGSNADESVTEASWT